MEKWFKFFLKGAFGFLMVMLYMALSFSSMLGLIYGLYLLGVNVIVASVISFLVIGSFIFGLEHVFLVKKYPDLYDIK